MAKKMIDMEYTKAERKGMYPDMAVTKSGKDNGPHYPWGLQIRLEKAEIDKLGMSKLPEIGQEFCIEATVRVTEVASAYRDQGNDSKVVTLQITAMELETPEEAKKEVEKEQ